MATPKYSIVIIDSTGAQYEFEQSTKRAWTRYENGVGRCQFFIPYNDLKLTTSSVPDNKYSRVRFYRDGTLVWQGIVSIIQDTIDGVYVYGETYEAALGWYGTRYNQTHTASGVGTIVTAEYDNIETRSGNFLTAFITQGTIQEPYQTSTTTTLTITRTLYNDNFLSFLREMVAVSKGEMTSSWAQNAVFGISISEATPTFTFTRNVGTNQASVVFELDSEIVDYNIPRDFRNIANSVKGFAIQDGPKVLTKTSADSTSNTAWLLREAYPYFGQATAQTDLDQKTDNYVRELKEPRRDMNIKFATGLSPFDGYVLGDSIQIRINRGRTAINEYRRVIGMEVTIDDTGIEQTSPILELPVST